MQINSLNSVAFKGLTYSKKDATKVITKNYTIDEVQIGVARVIRDMKDNFDRFAPEKNLELRFRPLYSNGDCFVVVDEDSFEPGDHMTPSYYKDEIHSYIETTPHSYHTYEQYMGEEEKVIAQAKAIKTVQDFADAAYKKFGIYDKVKNQSQEEKILNILS